jgi:hypothetical protein
VPLNGRLGAVDVATVHALMLPEPAPGLRYEEIEGPHNVLRCPNRMIVGRCTAGRGRTAAPARFAIRIVGLLITTEAQRH